MTELTAADPMKQLQSFCRGEMRAVEAYTAALLTGGVKPFAPTLRVCRQSHRERVRVLSRAIVRLGGDMPNAPSIWEVPAEAEGWAVVAVLEAGEEHGLRNYVEDLDKLGAATRAVIERQVLPPQRETSRLMTGLRHALK
jgi:hypothetical protein